jgi:hypothetical protein
MMDDLSEIIFEFRIYFSLMYICKNVGVQTINTEKKTENEWSIRNMNIIKEFRYKEEIVVV